MTKLTKPKELSLTLWACLFLLIYSAASSRFLFFVLGVCLSRFCCALSLFFSKSSCFVVKVKSLLFSRGSGPLGWILQTNFGFWVTFWLLGAHFGRVKAGQKAKWTRSSSISFQPRCFLKKREVRGGGVHRASRCQNLGSLKPRKKLKHFSI